MNPYIKLCKPHIEIPRIDIKDLSIIIKSSRGYNPRTHNAPQSDEVAGKVACFQIDEFAEMVTRFSKQYNGQNNFCEMIKLMGFVIIFSILKLTTIDSDSEMEDNYWNTNPCLR